MCYVFYACINVVFVKAHVHLGRSIILQLSVRLVYSRRVTRPLLVRLEVEARTEIIE